LKIVQEAPLVELSAYAVYPVRSAKANLIKEALSLFEYKVDLDELREYD